VPSSQQLLQQGLEHFHQGRHDRAEGAWRKTLDHDPTNSDAIHLLGQLALERGDAGRATEYLRRAIRLNPNAAEYRSTLGRIHTRLGQPEEAIACYLQALALRPSPPRAATIHNSLGAVLIGAGHRDQARSAFTTAIALDPAYAEAHNNLANVNQLDSRMEEAAAGYRQALALDPGYGEARANLARALHAAGNQLHESARYAEATAAYTESLALAPDCAEAHYNLAVTHTIEKRIEAARDCYESALRLKPDYAEAHNNLANVLLALGETEAALASYRQALAHRPDYLEARYNLGVALQNAERFDEAVVVYGDALDQKPDHADAHNNLGGIALAQAQPRQALAHYRQALACKPDHEDAAWNLGLAHLSLGEFEPGWEGYEARTRQKGFPATDVPQPRWQGEDLEGKTILLWAEQGLGDTIQFIRYVKLVKQRGARVIVECQPRLAPLLGGTAGIDHLVIKGELLPEFDCHSPLLSLPRLFGTRLDSIPAAVPYLAVPEDRRARWRAALDAYPGFRIGLSWGGSTANTKGRKRSIPLACLARLADLPGVRLFSLQRGAQAAELEALPPGRIVALEDDSTDVLDTAAIVAGLDLVITVDTMTTHLAGALARPVWTLAALRAGLALDDGPLGFAVVSDYATVPPAASRRLGCGGGSRRFSRSNPPVRWRVRLRD